MPNSNTIVVTRTDRVFSNSSSSPPRKPLHTASASTAGRSCHTASTATMSMTSCTSTGVGDDVDSFYHEQPHEDSNNCNNKKDDGGESELLLRLIAKEMVQSLVQEYSTMDGETGSVCSANSCSTNGSAKQLLSNLDIDAITQMVMSTVQKRSQNKGAESPSTPPQALKNMMMLNPKSNKSTDRIQECLYEDEDVDALYGVRKNTDAPSRVSKAQTATTSKSGSTSSSGGFSDLSNVTGGQSAVMDIMHPEFWSSVYDETDPAAPSREVAIQGASAADHKSKASSRCRSGGTGTGSGSGTSNGTYASDATRDDDADVADTVNRGKTLHAFLKDHNNEIVSSDSEESDNGSVLSDISGLTGVFSDFPDDRKNKNNKANAAGDLGTVRTGSTNGSGSKSSSNTKTGSLLLDSHIHSNATASTSSKRKQKKRVVSFSVSFGNVQVRQYERIMCDNPASAGGPSIGIGWQYNIEKPMKLDEYEVSHRSARRPKSPSELVLSRAKREQLIRSLGYGDREIAAVVREVNKLRFQRRQTVNNLSAQRMEEAVESAKRQVKRMLFLQRDPSSPKPSQHPAPHASTSSSSVASSIAAAASPERVEF